MERNYGLKLDDIALIDRKIYTVERFDMADNNRCYIKDIKNMDKEARKMTCEEVSMHKVDRDLYKLELNKEIKPEWIEKLKKATVPYQLQQIQDEVIVFGEPQHCVYFAENIDGSDAEKLLERIFGFGIDFKEYAHEFNEKVEGDFLSDINAFYEEAEKANVHINDEKKWQSIEAKFGLEGMTEKEAIGTIAKWKEKADIYDLVNKREFKKPKKAKKKNLAPTPYS